MNYLWFKYSLYTSLHSVFVNVFHKLCRRGFKFFWLFDDFLFLRGWLFLFLRRWLFPFLWPLRQTHRWSSHHTALPSAFWKASATNFCCQGVFLLLLLSSCLLPLWCLFIFLVGGCVLCLGPKRKKSQKKKWWISIWWILYRSLTILFSH